MRRLVPFAVAVVLGARAALGAVPGQMNYQGYLTDDVGVPLTGSYDVVFRLYDVGSTLLWEETHAGVQAAEGLFAVRLGETTPLTPIIFGADGVELEMEVDAEILNPRVPVVAAGYSIVAARAGSVGPDGIDTAAIQDLAVTEAKLADLSVTGGKLADGSVTSVKILDDEIVDADINANAAIATSKLAQGGAALGEVLEWTAGGWAARTDDDTTYDAGTGLTLAGTTFSHTAHTQDATGADALTVVALQGNAVSAAAPSAGQALEWNGSAWAPGTGLPVGAVIDWWRPNAAFPVPGGFMICDGTVVADAASPFDGETLPDLTDKFVRGVTDPANIGTTGGADVHTHTVNTTHDHGAATPTTSSNGSHLHSVDPPNTASTSSGGHTHTVNPVSTASSTVASHTHTTNPASTATSSTGSHNHHWLDYTGAAFSSFTSGGSLSTIYTHEFGDGLDLTGAGWYGIGRGGTTAADWYTAYNANHSHTVDIGSTTSSSVGTHSHTTDITSTGTTAAANHTHATDIAPFDSVSAANHNHTVTVDLPNQAGTGSTSSVSNVPAYVGLLKIMRVK